jgi:uncharacterized membrane protein YoaK (UPF0700 family)
MFNSTTPLSETNPRSIAIWAVMAFQAGAINVGGFLACHKFVTHTTGFATQFGAEAGKGNWQNAVGLLSVPLFFLFGSFLSALFVDVRLQAKKIPLYFIVFGLMSFILTVIASAGSFGFFGTFGAVLDLKIDYYLVSNLALTAGLQNATVTSAFSSVIRTTHLTGLTTDLGIGIARLFKRAHTTSTRSNEVKANFTRMMIIFSFILGSGLSAFLFINYEYLGFLIPAVIALMLFLVSLRDYLLAQRKQAVTT